MGADKKISQLQEDADNLRAQRSELSNSVEILTKKGKSFRKPSQTLRRQQKGKKGERGGPCFNDAEDLCKIHKDLKVHSKVLDLKVLALMQKGSRKTLKTLMAIALIVVLAVIALGVFAALTYPKTVISFPVSFTIGVDVEHREFDVPFLHEWAQVEVIINSGTALWTATITLQDKNIWNHTAHQGGQTTYKSGWIELPSGRYNFTLATAGLGSLEAEIKVTTKGGFW
jgi:hypothetical protein